MFVCMQRKYQNFAQADNFLHVRHEKWALSQKSLLGPMWVTKHQHFLCLSGKKSTFSCKQIRRQYHRHPIFLASDKTEKCYIYHCLKLGLLILSNRALQTWSEPLRKPKNASTLGIKLPKFKGYHSTLDYYSFRSEFEKLVAPRIASHLLSDYLKHNYLEGQALQLVKEIDDLSKIWERLKSANGNVNCSEISLTYSYLPCI